MSRSRRFSQFFKRLGASSAVKDELSLADLLWRQHSNPIAFLLQIEKLRAWRTVFLARLAGCVGLVLLLSLVAFFKQDVWRDIIAYATIAFFFLPVCLGLAIMVTHHPRFWLAYWPSPPLLLIVFLCALIPFSLLGWVGWLMFFYAIGAMVPVAGSVWVHKCIFRELRYPSGQRAEGLEADLPRLHLWNRVRVVRIGGAGLIFLGALLWLWFDPPEPKGLLLWVALAVAGGSLRLDAILLCWPGPLKLVTYDASLRRWRTTYSGRFALIAPQQKIDYLLATPHPSSIRPNAGTELEQTDEKAEGARAAEVLLILLREGTLGPTIRRACAKLPAIQAHRLLLHLSLQAGGATAIRYLQPKLALSQRPIALQYVALATEAAKPLDLQRWMAILPEQSEQETETSHTWEPRRITQLLAQVRQVLLSYEFSPLVDETQNDLQRFVERLDRSLGQDKIPTTSWPVTLLTHVDSHRKRLMAA